MKVKIQLLIKIQFLLEGYPKTDFAPPCGILLQSSRFHTEMRTLGSKVVYHPDHVCHDRFPFRAFKQMSEAHFSYHRYFIPGQNIAKILQRCQP